LEGTHCKSTAKLVSRHVATALCPVYEPVVAPSPDASPASGDEGNEDLPLYALAHLHKFRRGGHQSVSTAATRDGLDDDFKRLPALRAKFVNPLSAKFVDRFLARVDGVGEPGHRLESASITVRFLSTHKPLHVSAAADVATGLPVSCDGHRSSRITR
jgi:hypothetical protein